jgi:hypothetical protein
VIDKRASLNLYARAEWSQYKDGMFHSSSCYTIFENVYIIFLLPPTLPEQKKRAFYEKSYRSIQSKMPLIKQAKSPLEG